ncbi:hypothetical protein BDQ12DRAFT_718409 [Crucibulum laeve]|uniref:IMD domain-containing protein n=1 Tax=Crucibulum laeve TaxID=68775 RepID=A0A5C3MFF8_9AGAR|nr:hypothetical protein BDQ12DRAFT_718409 [Crucibulum laeve]
MAPSRPRSLRALAFGRRNTSPGPPSPTFSDTTHASAMNFGADGPAKIITRANLKASLQAYEDLMNTCANYRAALITMSKATASFADAMERCSGLKGLSYEAGTRLQAASGLHHLIGNHWHVLSETLDKSVEKPLRQHLDSYRTIVNERSAAYERALREKSQVIRDTEMRSMNRKERNLQSFREALAVLQRQVDDLDELKVSHYEEIIEHEEEVWEVVQAKVCVVVRSTMDVFDRFTAKASDPIIEPMLQSVPDPFDSYGPPPAEDQIFSILAPLSIMSNAPSSSPSPMAGTPERNDLDPLPSASKVATWLPNASTNNAGLFSESTEWASVPSPNSTPPRSVSPPSSMNRRHSVPQGQRKAESKLRSVLSVIDESRARHDGESSSNSTTPVPSTLNGSTPQPDTGPSHDWSLNYGYSPHESDNEEQLTPRNSIFSPHSPPPPPESPPNPDLDRRGPEVAT